MIEIIAHRGIFKKDSEKNSFHALKNALEKNIHIETDLRDFNGIVYISHDPILENNLPMTLDDLLSLYKQLNSKSILFLNVKSDGLHKLIDNSNNIIKNNAYFFDMSFPELIQYEKKGFNFLVRLSEFENFPNSKLNFKGFWVDSFSNPNWFFKKHIRFKSNKIYAFVSPDLHNMKFIHFWEKIKSQKNTLYLCTDFVDTAMEFFNE